MMARYAHVIWYKVALATSEEGMQLDVKSEDVQIGIRAGLNLPPTDRFLFI